MNVLILGGTGAMGTPLQTLLIDSGNNVYVTSRSLHQSRERLHYLHGNAKDLSFLKNCLAGLYYDAIVDFMSYSTSEFEERVRFLLQSTRQYIFISSARIFAESKKPLKEDSPRLLDTVQDTEYLKTDEYGLSKARQEDILKNSGFSNYTIVRPSVTYNAYRLQLGALEKENWLYRALKGRSIVFSCDLADKMTAMTHGKDVAKAIFTLVGNKECLKQSYNIAIEKSYTWHEVLNIYLDLISELTGKRPNVVMCENSIKLRDKRFKYQVIYARRFNRSFDNGHIKAIYHGEFTDTKEGLANALKEFLGNCRFNNINWKYEAWNDCIAQEYTPLHEIPTFRDKMMYLCYRYRMGYLFGVCQRMWHIVTGK